MFRPLALALAASILASMPALAQVTLSGGPEASPAPGVIVRARPLGDPALWLQVADYPENAVRAEVEGRVRFALIVGTDGSVSSCRVLESSNARILDEQTCALLTRRARFAAASLRTRKPAPDRWTGSVDWKVLEGMRPPPEPMTCYDCGLPWTMMTETLSPPKPAPRRKSNRRHH